MASLLLLIGAPMISSGDEMGRAQCGNNNACCQDNELSWGSGGLMKTERYEITSYENLIDTDPI